MDSGKVASFIVSLYSVLTESIAGRKTQHHAILENHNRKNKLDSYFYGDKKFKYSNTLNKYLVLY